MSKNIFRRSLKFDIIHNAKWYNLHILSWYNNISEMRRLIKNGAEVDRADQFGWTALHVSSLNGHVDAARLLLEKGADVHLADIDGTTPLYIACYKRHVDVARLLLEKGADVNQATKKGMTPLHVACCMGDDVVAQLLLDKGAEVDRALEDGRTPLYVACSEGYYHLVHVLLDNCAIINNKEIRIAYEMCYTNIVKLLINSQQEKLQECSHFAEFVKDHITEGTKSDELLLDEIFPAFQCWFRQIIDDKVPNRKEFIKHVERQHGKLSQKDGKKIWVGYKLRRLRITCITI